MRRLALAATLLFACGSDVAASDEGSDESTTSTSGTTTGTSTETSTESGSTNATDGESTEDTGDTGDSGDTGDLEIDPWEPPASCSDGEVDPGELCHVAICERKTYDSAGATVGDLDGDGHLDLFKGVNSASNENYVAEIYWGDGTTQVGSPEEILVGTEQIPVYVELADIDGNGDLDLVTSDTVLSSRLNNGGMFAPRVHSPGLYGNGVAAGDLDDDGDDDVVVASESANAISVLLSEGDGTFATPTLYGVGKRPDDLGLGDLDGDGDLDLATANSEATDVSVLLNDGAGTFAPQTLHAVATFPGGVAFGDLDQDGDDELVVVSNDPDDMTVFDHQAGQLVVGNQLESLLSLGPVIVVDLDGDGFNDIAAPDRDWFEDPDHWLSVSRGQQGGELLAPVYLPLPGPSSYPRIGSGDINEDGVVDLVIVVRDPDAAYGYLICIVASDP